jgi:hypothetical protein
MEILKWARAEWDRVAGYALIALGIVLLLIGWEGVSTSPYVADELSYIASGGLGGLLCAAVGTGMLVSADLRDEWRKLDRIERALDRLAGEQDLHLPPDAPPPGKRPHASSQSTLNGDGNGFSGTRLPDGTLAADPARPAALFGAAFVLLACALLAVGWHDVSLHSHPDSAFRSLAVSVTGLVVGGIAVGVPTLFLKRTVRLRQTHVFTPLERLVGERQRPFEAGDAVDVLLGPDCVWHWPGCPEVGMDRLPSASRDEANRTHRACSCCAAGE